MLMLSFPAAAFGTNCYVLASAEAEECLIVDPGIGVLDQLGEILTEHRLRPAAVLTTHGHVDHVYSVTPVCGAHDVPLMIHQADEYRLKDPYATLDPALRAMLEQQFGSAMTWTEPSGVRTIADGQELSIAGISLKVLHAPGHTEGSVMFLTDEVPDLKAGARLDASRTVLSGDVLFRGSIGRTDLPGGDHSAMLNSLRSVVAPLADDTLVLPGHGPATTMAIEKASNPYLMDI